MEDFIQKNMLHLLAIFIYHVVHPFKQTNLCVSKSIHNGACKCTVSHQPVASNQTPLSCLKKKKDCRMEIPGWSFFYYEHKGQLDIQTPLLRKEDLILSL